MTDAPALADFLRAPRYLDRPEGRIAYDDTGKGPLIVMVPGLGDIRAEYRKLAPLLVAAGFRVVTMDLRGHGQSTTGWSDYSSSALGSDVVAMIRHLGAGPAVVMGTSMGAAAVAWAAAEAPGLVSRVVLIGPFVRAEVDQPWWKLLMFGAMIKVGFAGPWGPGLWAGYYKNFYGKVPNDLPRYQQALAESFRQPGRMEALQGMMSVSKADVAARLHEVKAPVQIFMGTADPDFPDPAREAEIVAGLLRGEVVMVDGAGHYPQVEQPELVASRVLAFVAPQKAG